MTTSPFPPSLPISLPVVAPLQNQVGFRLPSLGELTASFAAALVGGPRGADDGGSLKRLLESILPDHVLPYAPEPAAVEPAAVEPAAASGPGGAALASPLSPTGGARAGGPPSCSSSQSGGGGGGGNGSSGCGGECCSKDHDGGCISARAVATARTSLRRVLQQGGDGEAFDDGNRGHGGTGSGQGEACGDGSDTGDGGGDGSGVSGGDGGDGGVEELEARWWRRQRRHLGAKASRAMLRDPLPPSPPPPHARLVRRLGVKFAYAWDGDGDCALGSCGGGGSSGGGGSGNDACGAGRARGSLFVDGRSWLFGRSVLAFVQSLCARSTHREPLAWLTAAGSCGGSSGSGSSGSGGRGGAASAVCEELYELLGDLLLRGALRLV